MVTEALFSVFHYSIARHHLFGSVIMLNILKDPEKISHIFSAVWILRFDKRKGSYIFSTVWISIFDKRKGSYIFSTVWIPIFDKSKDWCYLSILFYNAHKCNLSFHYWSAGPRRPSDQSDAIVAGAPIYM